MKYAFCAIHTWVNSYYLNSNQHLLQPASRDQPDRAFDVQNNFQTDQSV